ncbi:unnamed protein product, partial [Rotaria sp. Silwood2]
TVLDENEGIYVRDLKTGRVRAIVGNTYMLTQDEELWEKELPLSIEEFLQRDSLVDRRTKTTVTSSFQTTKRDKSRLVTYRVPQNQAVQVYDYKEKNSRIIFGPELVMLGPDEHFTYINLSGSVIASLFLLVFLSLLFVLKRAISNKIIFFSSIFAFVLYFGLRRFI